ncbi:MAG: hypothetical protein KIT33_09995 [Candidatus Kapabacteria bacterium]|nr:hypothetical protein [Ignavibacteriota bacterium]MCW5885289.1 hypothetical protein [Candidatus Kapabacteria bacterium]
MNDKILKFLEKSLKIEDSGVNFFSKSARRFSRISELKVYFETFARTKVSHKAFMHELTSNYKNHQLKIKKDTISDFDISGLESLLDDVSVVGDHSLPEDILKSAFNYLNITIKLYSKLSATFGFDESFNKMSAESKLVFDVVKKHIHEFTEEIRFYGYE